MLNWRKNLNFVDKLLYCDLDVGMTAESWCQANLGQATFLWMIIPLSNSYWISSSKQWHSLVVWPNTPEWKIHYLAGLERCKRISEGFDWEIPDDLNLRIWIRLVYSKGWKFEFFPIHALVEEHLVLKWKMYSLCP